ncbi:MAG: hypothetical protein KGL92_07425 [Gammaproteobacteria bacterium]|nr:hypothetical protein [Gammaproteobacteria bacterium]
MIKNLLKTGALCLVAAAATAAGASAASLAPRTVSLTQAPVVMRLSNDEFRIAFGIHAAQCAGMACRGVIHYRVDWKTEDGRQRSEIKQVDYVVSPRANRTIAVDRAYFDTAEGRHTTAVVAVHVDKITCTGASLTSL